MLTTLFLNILLTLFTPPIDFKISLAGNFGEPRPNHFHGGLDIRTEGVEGKRIYAIGDGYVSRVTMGIDGFGNAIYITHPSGHTSVYAHLKSFSPRIKQAFRRYQYEHQTSVADVRFGPLDLPVSQRQFIALSGNTGHSFAPHLHLEIHDTKTWNMLDPYQFLSDYIDDNMAPKVHAVMAVPVEGLVNGSTAKLTVNTKNPLTAWGKVGFAIWADDYMEGSHNHYGIHETLLYVDGNVVFRSLVDNIPTTLNRMVNAWGDYDYWMQHKRWYMKSYVEPGNTLDCLYTDSTRGVVNFNEERDYQLEYVLRDFKGNEVRYPFTVQGRKAELTPPQPADRQRLYWNRTNSVSLPGMQLVVPYGFVTDDTDIEPQVFTQPDAFSNVYQFAPSSLPLMYDAELAIYCQRQFANQIVEAFDPAKLYITNENGRYCGGKYEDGWVTATISELGARYELAYDDQPPTVKPLRIVGHRLMLSVTDEGSGISTWKATVDGRYIVFDALEKTTNYACELRESWLRPTRKTHRLCFEVTDRRQNTTVYEATFTY